MRTRCRALRALPREQPVARRLRGGAHAAAIIRRMTQVTTSDERPYSPGLEGVIGAQSAIGLVDGKNGRLLYRGYRIGELVERCTYAQVAELLWTGELKAGAKLSLA